MSEKELDFPLISGRYYGGDQNWYANRFMRLAGCSTTTACETCLCLARQWADMRGLYPGDPEQITRDDFCRFADLMFPYVHPDLGGLTDIGRYAAMLRSYAACCGISVAAELLPGEAAVGEAERFIRTAIEDSRPVSYLMLRHRNPAWNDFEWHWFSVTGYAERADGLHVTAATYGRRYDLLLQEAWNTGFARRGGLASVRPMRGYAGQKDAAGKECK